MCWADKLGCLWGFFVYSFLFVFMAKSDPRELYWFVTPDGLKLFFIVILLPWVALRLVDWLIGGPSRRSSRVRYYTIPR
jgi:hypothetical protein